MRYGMVQIYDGEPGKGLEYIQECARACEELGFASLWAPDHVVFMDHYESRYPHSDDGKIAFKADQACLEPMMVLLAAGVVTTRLRLGTAVEIVSERNPVERWKHVATLDLLTGGRVDYGVGIGWAREEYEAMGIPWERRGARADECIEAMKALWTQPRSSYSGEFVRFDGVIAYPKPVQRPHPPVFVGGVTRPALRRAARLGDGWYGWKLTPAELDDCLTMLDEELAAVGRTRDGFKLYLGLPHWTDPADLVPYVAELERRGVEELVLGLSLRRSRWRQELESYASALRIGG